MIILLKRLKQIVPKARYVWQQASTRTASGKQGASANYTWPKGNCNKILWKYLAGKDM